MTMNKTRVVLVSAPLVAVAFTIFSPFFEATFDATVFDAAVTKTCFDRHGYAFVFRWRCRSDVRSIGQLAISFACAVRKDEHIDICDNIMELGERARVISIAR